MIPLATPTSAGGASGSIVVARAELAWMAAADPAPANIATPHARAVIAHVGPFEVRGTIQSLHPLRWDDFLLARSTDGGFFALTQARVTSPQLTLETPLLAVNAARVAALLALD
jgi:hypothetical protein